MQWHQAQRIANRVSPVRIVASLSQTSLLWFSSLLPLSLYRSVNVSDLFNAPVEQAVFSRTAGGWQRVSWGKVQRNKDSNHWKVYDRVGTVLRTVRGRLGDASLPFSNIAAPFGHCLASRGLSRCVRVEKSVLIRVHPWSDFPNLGNFFPAIGTHSCLFV